jgi:hypothetical protein
MLMEHSDHVSIPDHPARCNDEVAGTGRATALVQARPTDQPIWLLQLPVFSRYFRTIDVGPRG